MGTRRPAEPEQEPPRQQKREPREDERCRERVRWPWGLQPGIRGRRGVARAPCAQPRRRGRPLARRQLVGPASLGQA